MILTIKTDQPTAKIALFNNEELVDGCSWQAHRQLAATLLTKIDKLLKSNQVAFPDISGIVVFRGPGSFTGLRIGITTANTLAYSLDTPVAGAIGEDWIEQGLKSINNNKTTRIVTPHYGGEANITRPKK